MCASFFLLQHKVVVIATTHNLRLMHTLGLADLFDIKLEALPLTSDAQVAIVSWNWPFFFF